MITVPLRGENIALLLRYDCRNDWAWFYITQVDIKRDKVPPSSAPNGHSALRRCGSARTTFKLVSTENILWALPLCNNQVVLRGFQAHWCKQSVTIDVVQLLVWVSRHHRKIHKWSCFRTIMTFIYRNKLNPTTSIPKSSMRSTVSKT